MSSVGSNTFKTSRNNPLRGRKIYNTLTRPNHNRQLVKDVKPLATSFRRQTEQAMKDSGLPVHLRKRVRAEFKERLDRAILLSKAPNVSYNRQNVVDSWREVGNYLGGIQNLRSRTTAPVGGILNLGTTQRPRYSLNEQRPPRQPRRQDNSILYARLIDNVISAIRHASSNPQAYIKDRRNTPRYVSLDGLNLGNIEQFLMRLRESLMTREIGRANYVGNINLSVMMLSDENHVFRLDFRESLTHEGVQRMLIRYRDALYKYRPDYLLGLNINVRPNVSYYSSRSRTGVRRNNRDGSAGCPFYINWGECYTIQTQNGLSKEVLIDNDFTLTAEELDILQIPHLRKKGVNSGQDFLRLITTEDFDNLVNEETTDLPEKTSDKRATQLVEYSYNCLAHSISYVLKEPFYLDGFMNHGNSVGFEDFPKISKLYNLRFSIRKAEFDGEKWVRKDKPVYYPAVKDPATNYTLIELGWMKGHIFPYYKDLQKVDSLTKMILLEERYSLTEAPRLNSFIYRERELAHEITRVLTKPFDIDRCVTENLKDELTGEVNGCNYKRYDNFTDNKGLLECPNAPITLIFADTETATVNEEGIPLEEHIPLVLSANVYHSTDCNDMDQAKPLLGRGDITDVKNVYRNMVFDGFIFKEKKTFFTDSEESATDQFMDYIGTLAGISYITPGGRSRTSNKVIIYFQNLRYDLSMFIRDCEKYGTYLGSASNCKMFKTKVGWNDIIFRDQCALIPMPLSAYKDSFDLPMSKMMFPYSYYTSEFRSGVPDKRVPVIDLVPHLKLRGTDLLRNRSKRLQDAKVLMDFRAENKNLIDSNDTINIRELIKVYCESDIDIQTDGFFKFRYLTKNTVIKVDTLAFLTISAISTHCIVEAGAMDGVYALRGEIRHFIANSIYGGRTMTQLNKKHLVPNKDVIYKDFVSLYPSAMVELIGFLKGKPKGFEEPKKLSELSQYDGYFVEVKFNPKTKPTELHFPRFIYKTSVGMEYVNLEANDTLWMIVCKQDLESIVKGHQLKEEDYIITRGYYFNEGRNEELKEVISKLFQERLKMKKAGNPCQLVYKNLLNSCYGRLIMKAHDASKSIRSFESEMDYYSFLDNAKDRILDTRIICRNEVTGVVKAYIETFQPTNTYCNYAHCGSEILGMSKTITYRVFDLAKEGEIEIYYTDTDSFFIEKTEKYDKMKEEFFNTYGYELEGKALSQVHSDFEPPFKNTSQTEEPYSTLSIFLGKKSLFCDVTVPMADGTERRYGHAKMKGIDKTSLTIVALNQQNYEEEIAEEEDLADVLSVVYGELCEGDESILIDCTLGNNPFFKYTKDLGVTSESTFARSITFHDQPDTLNEWLSDESE